jgi:hypothetical protein
LLAIVLAGFGGSLVAGIHGILHGIALPILIYLLDREHLRQSASDKPLQKNCGRYVWVAALFASLACALCVWLVFSSKGLGPEPSNEIIAASFFLFFTGLVGLVGHSHLFGLVAASQVLSGSTVLLLAGGASRAADQPGFASAVAVSAASFLLLTFAAALARVLFLKWQVRSSDELRLLRG